MKTLFLTLLISFASLSQALAANEADLITGLTFMAEDGSVTTLDTVRDGKPVYVAFFPAWCFYYTEETDPEFAENCNKGRELMTSLHAEFGDQVYFLTLLANMSSGFSSVAFYKNKFEIPHAVGFDEEALWMRTLRVREFPAHFFIARNGVLLGQQTGLVEDLKDQLTAIVQNQTE